jgi:ketosteroid isomerase-like protein
MVNIQADKLEIEQMIKRVEAAENRHDVNTMLEDMIDDPLLHLCSVPPVKGQDAVRQLYGAFFETFVSTRITSQQIQVSSSGDMAWDYGVYVNEYQSPDGRTKEEGKYLGIYHKVDGKWKGAVFCITPNGK